MRYALQGLQRPFIVAVYLLNSISLFASRFVLGAEDPLFLTIGLTVADCIGHRLLLFIGQRAGISSVANSSIYMTRTFSIPSILCKETVMKSLFVLMLGTIALLLAITTQDFLSARILLAAVGLALYAVALSPGSGRGELKLPWHH
ncbi:MAG: hypothetical protein ACQEUY_05325 [Pseudomonadota bacterium]